jgi:hypothetical protein
MLNRRCSPLLYKSRIVHVMGGTKQSCSDILSESIACGSGLVTVILCFCECQFVTGIRVGCLWMSWAWWLSLNLPIIGHMAWIVIEP